MRVRAKTEEWGHLANLRMKIEKREKESQKRKTTRVFLSVEGEFLTKARERNVKKMLTYPQLKLLRPYTCVAHSIFILMNTSKVAALLLSHSLTD